MTDKDKRLKTLRIKRGTFKTQITLFKNYLNKLDKNKLNNTDIQNLECRISKIEPIYTDFNQIQGEIESILDDDQDALTQAILEREQFDDYYFETLSLANGFLVISNDLVVQSQASNTVPNMQVKLPTIKLPTFDGNYTFWNEYRDSFETLIGNNNQLSNVHKLTYLKSSLINEPAELVRSFETISQNYQLAWDALQKKYNNKRRIITTHVQLLLDVPKINKESHSCLRLLINQVENHTQCLKALGQPIEEWDALIIPIITSKLDFQTNKEWELKLNSEPDSFTRLPTLTELLTFLNNKQNTLQTIYKGDKDFDKPKTQSNKIIRSFATANITCVFCNKDHNIHSCDIFNKLNENERNSKVRELKLCINCLRKGHFVNNCISKNTCKICHKGHHTLLHKTNQKKENDHARVAVGSDETVVTCSSEVKESSSQVLLSTALVHAQYNQGQLIEIRALLDSASQSNFISEGICEKLKLNKCPINTTVTGISNGLTKITHKVQVTIKSLHNNYTTVVSCLVLPKITTCLPSQSFNKELIKIPSNIVLADPLFNRSGNIDMLLGASIFYELLCIGQIREKNNPILQKTKFGWVISGNLYKQYVNQRPTQAFLTLNELNESVERFWKAEEISTQEQLLTPEEKYCENYFAETTTRDSSGRFNVRIPFKTNINQLGDSRQLAENRFHKLEKRFERDPDYKGMYEEFINEYIQLDHMTKIPPDNKRSFFLPHHAVIKESSETTKLRVVFDGSCKLNNGLALNETQCVGPTIQQELFTIIVRFRTYNYVLTADIAKMYRQIIIHSEDRSYQRILWRSQPTIELEQYELKTVTYGTTAAPFLAIRALYQLGLDNETLFPKEAEVIKGDFYVDDMLTGTNTIDELKVVKANVDKILKTAGFNLRKWTSNVRELCDKELVNSNESSLNENLHKTLGIYWNPNTDEFTYATEIKFQTQITKRTILATSAQLFDPLGLLSPIIIMSKFILQELWQHKIDWDEPVPAILQEKWLKFRDKLKFINQIHVPRHILISQPIIIEMHSFSDASERGYGACIYLRSTNKNEVMVKLLAAKSRVAPLKNVTLPRLELNAAVLAAKLSSKFRNILKLTINKEYYWCDSKIVLCWIKSPSNKWKTYVANRVSEIQTLTNVDTWHHVNSSDNPADLISRGVLPNDLINLKFWWQGPRWLSESCEAWPNNNDHDIFINEPPELRKRILSLPALTLSDPFPIVNFSTLNKAKRITAWCIRFKTNCLKSKDERCFGPLTVNELHEALTKLAKISQIESFPKEYNDLIYNRTLYPKSRILSLNPFLDEFGVMRVGGRIQLSNFCYDKKHPIIMSNIHHLTKLIFKDEHVNLLHAGPSLLLSSIRERFWPVSGRNIAKQTVRECVRCFRFNSNINNPIMGQLPKHRTESLAPFHTVGIDYAGPFLIRDRKGKGSKTSKCYISLFICFSTKAIHLELVSDLTTNAFLAAFRRFTARRGKPSHVYSDNGKNFVGANSELKKLGEFLVDNGNHIAESTANQGITWHFIPAHAPHFGGLWEAGVKSTKYHLKRIMTNASLTFEDMYTILTQIESILNSRPLTPLSSDPNDLDVLTPAHFLIGRSFTSIPDPDVRNIQQNRLDRYQYLQQLNQHFWDRWSKEYISEMQQRTKWKQSQKHLKIGTMVLIKEDNTPPSHWQLGRVINIHPGKDGVPRVVTVKCASGEIKRAVAKVCVLPIETNQVETL